MFKKKNKKTELDAVMDKNTTVMALTNVLHLCRNQSDYSLSLEEIAGTIGGVLDKAEVQALITQLLKVLKR